MRLILGKRSKLNTLNSERGLTMALKGLPETPSEEILLELKAKGLNPTSCVSVVGKGNTHSPFFTYKVSFPQGTAPTAVSKINVLFSTRVYWEKFFSKRNYTQCFCCQAYGHSAANCGLPPKCVKCSGSHRSADCQKLLETPPKCVNCGGQHTANYGQCPALQKYLEKRNKNFKPNNGIAFNARDFPI